MTGPVSGAGPVLQAVDIRGMDLETALMAVQSNRASLLESQLKGQIEDVQKKNDRIAAMNQLLGTLNGMASKFDGGAKAGDTKPFTADEVTQLAKAYEAAGMAVPPELSGAVRYDLRDTLGYPRTVTGSEYQLLKDKKAAGETSYMLESGATRGAVFALTDERLGAATRSYVGADLSKGTIDKKVQELKSNIDALSNSQQMDMLRLQSLSNKRNEAFDIMTNSVKKFADARSSIVGNMR